MLSLHCFLGRRYKLVKKLGAGAFGDVFSCLNIDKNTMCAVKFEKSTVKKEVLPREMETLTFFRNTKHFANIYFYGKFKNYRFLVMDLMGPSLLFVIFSFGNCF
jgi:serine/threonine protein kinase